MAVLCPFPHLQKKGREKLRILLLKFLVNLHVHDCITSLAVSSLQTPTIVHSLSFGGESVIAPIPSEPLWASPLHFSGAVVEFVGLLGAWHSCCDVVSWTILHWPSNKGTTYCSSCQKETAKHAFGGGPIWQLVSPLKAVA